jgi:hypothetical protein
METKKQKRSLRVGIVIAVAVAGTALIGWGGLAAWSAYTDNAGNTANAGTVQHNNSLCSAQNPSSSNSLAVAQGAGACQAIFTITGIGPGWAGQTGSVTITDVGSLNSLFGVSVPSTGTGTPADSVAGGTLCSDLNVSVQDNESPSQTVYSGSLDSLAGAIRASNGDGASSTTPWVRTDSGTYTFDLTLPGGGQSTDSGDTCTFDVLFTQTTA